MLLNEQIVPKVNHDKNAYNAAAVDKKHNGKQGIHTYYNIIFHFDEKNIRSSTENVQITNSDE